MVEYQAHIYFYARQKGITYEEAVKYLSKDEFIDELNGW